MRFERFLVCTLSLLLVHCSSDEDDTKPTGGAAASSGASGSGASGTGGSSTGGSSTGGSSTGGGAGMGGAGAGGSAGAAGSAAGAGGFAGTGPLTCVDASSCAAQNVCDPVAQYCSVSQCDPTVLDSCTDPSALCLAQIAEAGEGACYPTCIPFSSTSTCDDGFECVPVVESQQLGICKHFGTNDEGQTCTGHNTSTDCVAGHICADVGTTTAQIQCVEQCDFFADSAQCQTVDAHCSYGGWCLTGEVDSGGIGSSCPEEGQDCGLDQGIARGVCLDFYGSMNSKCYRWCRDDNDCDTQAEQECYDIGVGDIGVCVVM